MNVVESRRLSVPCVGQSIPCRCKLGIRPTNCFLESQEVLCGNEAHNFRSGGIRDQDADSGPWTVDKCTASMALKASSSIFIECHILTHEGLLTTWIQAGLPRQRNLKKLGINRINCSSWKREPWFSPARQAFWNDDCGRPAVSESFGIPNRIWIPPAPNFAVLGISFFPLFSWNSLSRALLVVSPRYE